MKITIPKKSSIDDGLGDDDFVYPTSETAQKHREESDSDILWKPKEGLNKILILPAKKSFNTPKNLPWVETSAHYCGGRDVLNALGLDRNEDIPMLHGCVEFFEKRPCGWCQFRRDLYSSRNPLDKELHRALYPSFVCYANIVDLSAPNSVRQYRFGKKVRGPLLSAIEYGSYFFRASALMEIHIRKKITGSHAMNVEYECNVLVQRPTVKIEESWKSGLKNLSEYIPAIPDDDEIKDVISLLKAYQSTGGPSALYDTASADAAVIGDKTISMDDDSVAF